MVLAELALVYVPALAVGLAACVSTMAIGISDAGVLGATNEVVPVAVDTVVSAALTGRALGCLASQLLIRGALHTQLKDR